MSFDLNLPTVCDHRIYKEYVTLYVDRKTIRLSKPMAAAGNLELYASDDLVPSDKYSIIYDPIAIDVNRPRMIVLKNKWKATQDFFQVSYNTLKGFCPKCAGLESIDDINYNVRGDFLVTRDERLLLQNLEKFTVTEVGSNALEPFIGTSLVTLLGERVSDRNFIAGKVKQEISASLSALKDMQEQYRQTGRPVSLGEQLDVIEKINVSFDQNDPTILRADVTARAKSGKSIDYAQYLRLS